MSSRLRSLLARFAVLVTTVALLLAGGEWLVTKTVITSFGAQNTLANKRWNERYWHLNSLGFRDVERSEESLAGKTRILVIGDSFPAGVGVKDPEDRFPNQLGHLLGDNYAVMIGAVPGTETDAHLYYLETYPFEPDAVILSYFVNDIGTAVTLNQGVTYPQFDHWPYFHSGLVRYVVDRSSLANYLYWHIYAWNDIAAFGQRVRDIWKDGFQDEQVMRTHEVELLGIYGWTLDHDVPLVVVTFPSMGDLSLFEAEVNRMQAFFESYGIPVVNLTEQWKQYTPEERVASRYDPHPSVLMHHQVGEALAQIDILHSPENYSVTEAQRLGLSDALYQDYVSYEPDLTVDEGSVLQPLPVHQLPTRGIELQIGHYVSENGVDAQPFFDLMKILPNVVPGDEVTSKTFYDMWKNSLNPAYLHVAGFRYVLASTPWLNSLTPKLRDYLEASENYVLVQEWHIPGMDYLLYRVDTPRFAMSEENLTAYEAYSSESIPSGVSIFDPSNGLAGPDELRLLTSAMITDDMPQSERDKWFDLLTTLEQVRREPDLDLDEDQQAALDRWRTSKSAVDLNEAGFEYLFVSDQWLGFASAEEAAIITESGDYQLLQTWEIPEIGHLWLYQTNR